MNVVRWLSSVHSMASGLGVIAMLLHECGHLISRFILGVRIKRVGMKWNKGLYTVREQGTPVQNLARRCRRPPHEPSAHGRRLPGFLSSALANFCYALANVLPIEGSDGYRIALCWQQLRLRAGTGKSDCRRTFQSPNPKIRQVPRPSVLQVTRTAPTGQKGHDVSCTFVTTIVR